MSEILLVNPRRRRRRASTTKRRRTAAKRRANPRKRRAAPRARRRVSRRRRNPAPRLNVRSIQGSVMNAVPGAFGALSLDIALGVIPVPAQFKSGLLGYGVKGIGAILIGMLAGNVVKAQTATRMTEGALTVMIHGALKQGVAQFAPQIPLSAYDDSGYPGSGWNPNYSMGAYLEDNSYAQPVEELGEYMYDPALEAGY